MNIKLVTITWSYSDSFEIEKTSLYKSFKRFNPNKELIHFHFNRGHYWQLENEYSQRFGAESEYLLYKITLLLDKIKTIDSEYIIFCDANDVTCLKSIDTLENIFDLENHIIIGHEKNMWPTPERKLTWPNYKDYSGYDLQNRCFLNSGMILSKKDKFCELLQSLIDNVFSTNINTFSNDQGVYTYYYNMGFSPKIKLDYGSLFALNTFTRNPNDYYMENNCLISKETGTSSYFVHDNGWNHGSPKFHNFFEFKQNYE